MKDRSDPEATLIKLFGSTSRARILSLFFGSTGRSFYQREVMYETGLSLQTVQRELSNLVDLGIIISNRTSINVFYEVNLDSPFHRPLVEICRAAKGEQTGRAKPGTARGQPDRIFQSGLRNAVPPESCRKKIPVRKPGRQEAEEKPEFRSS
jgi:hypothetical protein